MVIQSSSSILYVVTAEIGFKVAEVVRCQLKIEASVMVLMVVASLLLIALPSILIAYSATVVVSNVDCLP